MSQKLHSDQRAFNFFIQTITKPVDAQPIFLCIRRIGGFICKNDILIESRENTSEVTFNFKVTNQLPVRTSSERNNFCGRNVNLENVAQLLRHVEF